MPELQAVEIVRVRPKPGAEERLMELWPEILRHYTAKHGDGVHAQLFECEDGTWVDIWAWATRAIADEELANVDSVPAFVEWKSLVETVGFDWATPKR